MSIQKRFISFLPLLTVLFLTTVIFLPMLYHWRNTGDFNPHTVYIDRILAGDNAVFYETPNFLYHLGILGLHFIFPTANITALVVIVSLAWYWLLAAMIYLTVAQSLSLIGKSSQTIEKSDTALASLRFNVIAVFATMALLVITPITLFTPENQYFGYMTPYVYHNPTMIPLRPLSLMLFIVGVWVFRKQNTILTPKSKQSSQGADPLHKDILTPSPEQPSQGADPLHRDVPSPSPSPLHREGNQTPPLYEVERGQGGEDKMQREAGGENKMQASWGARFLYVFLTALLTWACILAKPSFVMILLPALALVTLWQMIFHQPINWFLLIGGIVIPAVALLGYQALTWTDGGMAFSPFETFRLWDYHYDPNTSANLMLKLLMSLLFPMMVYAAYFQQAQRDLMLNLAWLIALVGTAFAYLFIDTGDPVAGNLTWNGQIGVFILYIASMLFFLRENRPLISGTSRKNSVPFMLCLLIFGIHLISGINWYGLHLNGVWPDIIYGVW